MSVAKTDSNATVNYPDSESATLENEKVPLTVEKRSATKAKAKIKAAVLNKARLKAHNWDFCKGCVK